MSTSPLQPFVVQPGRKPGVENGLSGPSPGAQRVKTDFDGTLQDVQRTSEPSKDRLSESTDTDSGTRHTADERVDRSPGPEATAEDRQATATEDSDAATSDSNSGTDDSASDVGHEESPQGGPQEEAAERSALEENDTIAAVEGQKTAQNQPVLAPVKLQSKKTLGQQPVDAKLLESLTDTDGTSNLRLNGENTIDLSERGPLALEQSLIAEGVGLQEELSSIDPALTAKVGEEALRRMPPELRAHLLGEHSVSEQGSDLAQSSQLVSQDIRSTERPDLLALDRAVAADDAVHPNETAAWNQDRPLDGTPGLRDLRSLNYEKAYASLQQRADKTSVPLTDLSPIAQELEANGTDIKLLDLRVSRLTENVRPVMDTPTAGSSNWTVDSKLDAMATRLASMDPTAEQSPQALVSETETSLPDVELEGPVQTRAGEALRFSGTTREESRVVPTRSSEGGPDANMEQVDAEEVGLVESDSDISDVNNLRRKGVQGQVRTRTGQPLMGNQNAHFAANQSIQNPDTLGAEIKDTSELINEPMQARRQATVPQSPLPAMNRVELTLQDPAGKLRIAVEQAENASREVGVRLEIPEAAMADFNGAGSELEQDLEGQGMLLSYFEANANNDDSDASFEDFESELNGENPDAEAAQSRVHPSAMRSSGMAGRLLSAVA